MKSMARPITLLVLVVGLLTLAARLQAQSQVETGQARPDWAAEEAGTSAPSRDRFFFPTVGMTEQQQRGEFLYLQGCALCHLPRLDKSIFYSNTPVVYYNLQGLFKGAAPGKEEEVRDMILLGSANMPAFRWAFEPQEIDDLIAYLKTR